MNNKEIGILTFHRAVNYGAVLQGYALYRTLCDLGAAPVMIDYRNPKLEWRRKKIRYEKNNKVKSLLHSMISMPSVEKKKRQFGAFNQKYLTLSQPCTQENISDITNRYQCFITGSDQVFSPTCVDFDPVYFLTFAKPEQKYSYAASFGTAYIDKTYEDEMKKRLNDFKKISVREESGKEIIRQLCDRESFVNIDPSLLLGAVQWSEIASERLIKEKYILVFRVNKPIQLLTYAKKLAEEKELKIVYITDIVKKREKNINYVKAPSVEEFLSYIKNAEYVCTNSFHGTAFSIIFNRKIIVETNTQTGTNNRIKELLKILEIKNRDISNEVQADSEIAWDSVNQKIEEKRRVAKDYLRSIVEE